MSRLVNSCSTRRRFTATLTCWTLQEAMPFSINDIHGICHITGGGLSNLLRLHPTLGWDIHTPLPVLPEFTWLQCAGGVETREMYRTFNMGMGMVIAVDSACSEQIVSWLQERMPGAALVGHVRDDGHHVKPPLKVELLSLLSRALAVRS